MAQKPKTVTSPSVFVVSKRIQNVRKTEKQMLKEIFQEDKEANKKKGG
jgi:hypothetical protein